MSPILMSLTGEVLIVRVNTAGVALSPIQGIQSPLCKPKLAQKTIVSLSPL